MHDACVEERQVSGERRKYLWVKGHTVRVQERKIEANIARFGKSR